MAATELEVVSVAAPVKFAHECLDTAEEDGAARERAAIVAWLRGVQPRAWGCTAIAHGIECGDHLPAKSAGKEPGHGRQCICPFPRLACPDCGHASCPACARNAKEPGT